MIYRVPKISEIDEIIIMKNNVKKRIVDSGMPMWLNGYPLDEMIVEDVHFGDARVIELDGKIVAYAHYCHASKEYDSGTFKKDNLQTFGRVMVNDGYTGMQFDVLRKTPFAIYDDKNALLESGYMKLDSIDKSIHQGQMLELPFNKLLIHFGQNLSSRKVVILDLDWLYINNQVLR